MLVALDDCASKPRQIVIAGEKDRPDTRKLLAEVRRHYLPNGVLLLADQGEGQRVSRGKVGGDAGNEDRRRQSDCLRLRKFHLSGASDGSRATCANYSPDSEFDVVVIFTVRRCRISRLFR